MRRTWLLLLAAIVPIGCEASTKSPPNANSTPLKLESPSETRETDLQERPPAPRAVAPEDWFENVTARSGIQFRYRNGREANQFTLLETVGGGVAMIDYDQDGDLDLFFTGGGSIAVGSDAKISGRPGALFRNDGDWRFVDVTNEAGLADAGDYSHGVTVADYDRNGFPDLLVTCYGRCQLWRNEGGKFKNVTVSAGLDFSSWNTAAAWADIDGNGFPDLYVAAYADWKFDPNEFCGDKQRGVRDVCPPSAHPAAQDRLFRNRADGTFEEITKLAGIKGDGKGLGVLASDLNGDGQVDFYVANDVGDNHLYWGAVELPWKEAGLWAGVANQEFGLAQGSMGVDVGDYNGDGVADIFVTNFELENNALYRGEGRKYFVDATLPAGLRGRCFSYVGFGTGFADFDGDGWLDLFVCNGNVYYTQGHGPYEQPAFLFQNVAGKKFRDVSMQCGPYFRNWHVGRGAAVGDLDDDGAPDLVIVHQNEPVVLLRNRKVPARWVRLQLEGVHCDREAVGAKISYDYQGRQLVRWVRSGAGYLSQFDQRVILPVDQDDPVSVKVVWPGGKEESFSNLEINTTHRLIQGEG